MKEKQIKISEIRRENRQLRSTIEMLLEEIESDGPVECDCVREKMPEHPGKKDPIEPPWEREGYDSKEAWIEDR